MNIVVVNYNTQEFLDKCIRSINKFVKEAHIIVFDNSDKKPFTNTFQNVDIIDNTKGQIIDFDKFLNQYPNRKYSSGKENNFASAKHAYTVEKCIEMFNESFILIDSDILLKKDITELYHEDYLYVAEELTQGNGIKRVSPHLCFINTKMCKDNNVHYFDEDYMHGLHKTTKSDEYDTGAAFYIHANKHKHMNIIYSDYIVHYGHGSWNEKNSISHMTPNQFLEKYKDYWS